MHKGLRKLLSVFGLSILVSQFPIQGQAQVIPSSRYLNVQKMSGRFYGTEGSWTYRFDTSFGKSFTGDSLDFKIEVACKVDGGFSLGPVDSEGFHSFVFRNPHIGQIEQALASKKPVTFVINGFSQSSSIVDDTESLSEFFVTSARKGFLGSKKIAVKLTEYWQYAGSSGEHTITLAVGSDGKMTIKGLQNKDRSKTVGTVTMIPAAEFKFRKMYKD